MKTRKRSLKTFLYYDYHHVAAHLEKMARKGWMLSRITKLFWEYHRIEPAELKFSVAYFLEASDWNLSPAWNQEEYWAYCESAGWKLAAEWDQMQIMYSEEEDPVPIETDEGIKLRMIQRAMKKRFLPAHTALVVLGILQMLNWIPREIKWFYTDIFWVFLLALMLLTLYFGVSLFGYILWYKKSARLVEGGGRCAEPKIYRGLSAALLIVTNILLLAEYVLLLGESGAIPLMFLGSAVVLFLGCFGLLKVLKEVGVPEIANFICTMIVCVFVSGLIFNGVASWISDHEDQFFVTEKEIVADDLALVVEDLKVPDYQNAEPVYELDQKQSIFMRWERGRQYVTSPSDAFDKLEYQIYEVKIPWLYDCFLRMITGENSLQESSDWQQINRGQRETDAVYQYQFEPGMGRLYEELYVICDGERIVRLGIDWETTESELDTAFAMFGIVRN